ncbi:MAG TPA: hypothetical protein VFO01_09420 [Trebonia sp.]|nr:hypothetical protein [Trebonia sp.]
MANLEAWSYGASIITFLVPMLTFAAVALTLLILYTKPETLPGQVNRGNRMLPVIANRFPGKPLPGAQAKTDESAGK